MFSNLDEKKFSEIEFIYKMFYVHRKKKEKEILKKAIEMPGHCVIVYSNRRVGKTTLINETMKESDNLFVSFECLKSSMKNNINGLIKLLKEMGISNFYPDVKT